MWTIFLASNNAHKAEEFAVLLGSLGERLQLRSAREIGGMPEVEESAADFVGNARIKAEALVGQLPTAEAWALADDSGLEVDALGGAPGVHSARYAGEHGNSPANNRKLLAALAEVPLEARTARFRCALVLRRRDGAEAIFEGRCEGRIASTEAGKEGFGYDPLFVPEGFAQSFGELPEGVKSACSHRARAVHAWLEAVEKGAWPPPTKAG